MAQNEITLLISSFHELTGVGICFYDTARFFQYHVNGEKAYTGHYCEFCRCTRLLQNGKPACEKNHRQDATDLAQSYQKPFFFKCHMGLCELVVPVMKDERLLGLVFLGQCRIEGEDASDEVRRAAQALGGDPETFAGMYAALPEMKRGDLLAMGNLMSLYFSKLGDVTAFFGHAGITAGQNLPLGRRMANYIERLYAQDLTPQVISERFFINQSYAARVFRRDMGMSMTQYLRKVRLDNAKRLLRNTTISVGSIALNVGCADANYFTRIFTREVGMTPTEYRSSK